MPVLSGPDSPSGLQALLDSLGRIRYGVPTSEKERLARTGELPGAPAYSSELPDEENMARADRYASGYLFGKTHPTIAPIMQEGVNTVKTSDLPLLGGSSPELQSFAQQGVNAGSATEQPQNDLLLSLIRMLSGKR